MALLFRLFWIAPFIALLAVSSRSAPDDPAPAPARTVEGIATTASGKLLAHVTLYLFGLPPGQTDMITLGDQSTVVTDDRGRFTWAVPAAAERLYRRPLHRLLCPRRRPQRRAAAAGRPA